MQTDQRITKGNLVYLIVIPLLMLATPARAATILFSEGFEYTDSLTNHGWTSVSSGSFATSTDVAFEGARSVRLESNASITHSLNEVNADSVDKISIYYYDSMLSGGNWDVNFHVWFDNASQYVGLGWYNPSQYVIYESGTSPGFLTTTVPRSQGWHRFEWLIHNGQVDLLIDGVVVASNFRTVSTVSSIGLAVGSEPPLFAYVDKIEVAGPVAPPPVVLDIDIKPGSFPNSINPHSEGTIPVAILTTNSFDATTVDPTTVLFGPTGSEAAPVHFALEDVDGDGNTDMILHFNTQATGIQCGDTSASLTGETLDGQMIEGSDSVNTVGCK